MPRSTYLLSLTPGHRHLRRHLRGKTFLLLLVLWHHLKIGQNDSLHGGDHVRKGERGEDCVDAEWGNVSGGLLSLFGLCSLLVFS